MHMLVSVSYFLIMESEVYILILHIITFLTVAVQLYVAYLVQYESPKSMREYRFFLNLFTVGSCMVH